MIQHSGQHFFRNLNQVVWWKIKQEVETTYFDTKSASNNDMWLYLLGWCGSLMKVF